MTVLPWTAHDKVNSAWVASLVDDWLRQDDVFRLEFLQGIVVVADEDSMMNPADLPASFGTKWTTFLKADSKLANVSPGPYVVWNNELCKLFRVCDDSQLAFITATNPQVERG